MPQKGNILHSKVENALYVPKLCTYMELDTVDII